MAVVSSHILNGTDGTHAGGIRVRLIHLKTSEEIASSETRSDGRFVETVDLKGADPTDKYELVFDAGNYWTERSMENPQGFNEIVVRFAMPDADARYHMPIILSPNSYSIWASIPE